MLITSIISIYLFTPDSFLEITGEGRRLQGEESFGIYYCMQGGDAIDVLSPAVTQPWVNICHLNL